MRGTVLATVLAAAAAAAAIAYLGLSPGATRSGPGSGGGPDAAAGPSEAADPEGGEERPGLSTRPARRAVSPPPPAAARPTPEEEAWLAGAIAHFDKYSAGEKLRVLGNLRRMGPKALAAVPALVARLGTDDLRMRRALAYAIGSVGREALPAILAATADADPLVRAGAVQALGVAVSVDRHAGLTPSAETIAAFLSALADTDPDVRFHAAAAAQGLGPGESEVVDALLARLSDPAHGVRAAAADAMGLVVASGEGASALPLLAARLDSDDSELVRQNAARAIPAFGDEAASAVPALVRAVRGDAILVSREAFESLRRMGSTAAAAVPDLLALARLEDEETRLAAVWTLAHVAPGDPRAIALFEECLSEGVELRDAAISGLVWAGAAGLPALARAAGDPERASALDRVEVGIPRAHGANTKQVLRDLVALVAREEEALARLGLRSLARIGEWDSLSEDEIFACLPPVLAAVRGGKTPEVRVQALEAVVGLGPEESPRFLAAASPTVVAACSDADPTVRQRALSALEELGAPGALVAVTALPLLTDGDKEVRETALRLLRRGDLGTEAAAVQKAVERMAATDPSPELRQEAADYLRRATVDQTRLRPPPDGGR